MRETTYKRLRGYYRSVYLSVKRALMIEELCEHYGTNQNDLLMQLLDQAYEAYLEEKNVSDKG